MSIFYDPYMEKDVTQRRLPHWSQQGRLHFVTFRLADSIPIEQAKQFRAEKDEWKLRNAGTISPEKWKEYHLLFSERMQGWLDSGMGQCVLAQPECADVVSAALEYFRGTRYRLDHWVIMPNHVHILVMPLESYTLSAILHSWKSFTSHKINKLCGCSGTLWQRESFDHIVRSEPQLMRLRSYIVSNASHCGNRARLNTGTLRT